MYNIIPFIMDEENDLLQDRRDKLNLLARKGIQPFGYGLKGLSFVPAILIDFKEGASVFIAGRLFARREHGKATFADLRSEGSKIQIYVKEDILGKDNFEIFCSFDIGDIVSVEGELFKTRTGEPTIKAVKFGMVSKSLRPLPEKWHGLKDVEIRYRQRYLDLIANHEVRDIFVKRSKIISSIRAYFDKNNYLEVETPMMHPIPGGAAGRPFKTYHNEYDMDLYLRIAPELYLKKLLVGGLDRVYEINRSFRNEGVSTRHNPEFTMLEVYTAYSDCEGMMNLVQELVVNTAQQVFGTLKFEYQGKAVDLTPPWRSYSFADKVKERFGIIPEDSSESMLVKLKDKGKALSEKKLSRSQIVRIIEDLLTEGEDYSAVFVTDYFSILCPLAKNKEGNSFVSDRFELFIAGMEVANAYSELNDPREQRRRLEEDTEDAGLEKQDQKIDEDFLTALEYGMPPAGGLGIGIDRLVMILTNQPSIRDVILFPLLRNN